MGKNLIIVESPTKAKTLSRFLRKNYKLMASIGHLRDLPKSKMGIDIENDFEPQYINVRGKAKTINEIKKEAKKADKVYLASDPDREGEAIAWHLAFLLDLDLDEENRIVFNEITKEAVIEAIENPRKIHISLVDAQQARRVMDRIVGYELSPILWKKIKGGLSAGRVQSVALKLIVDREEEIKKFIPEEYWSIIFQADVDKKSFEGRYFGRFIDEKLKSVKISNEKQADEILAKVDKDSFKVIDKITSKKTRRPNKPFTTSTLQQEASSRLNFSTSKTMSIAQQLYEGINIAQEGTVGLISYMRTDSTRLSSAIVSQALDYINDNFGKAYASRGNTYSKKGSNTQDAHEAIRVSSIYRTPYDIKDYLSQDQFKLYRLIWERTLASQMKPSRYLSTRYDVDNNGEIFKVSGSIMEFDGYTKVWKTKDNTVILPDLSVGDVFSSNEITKNQHFTKPKARFTEASLVKKLEENGIGRPSTYSSIIRSITSRRYVDFENKSLYPTELGFSVNDLLTSYFENIINEDFTAAMESELDRIEAGQLPWKDLMHRFYDEFKDDLDHAKESAKKIEIKVKKTGESCPECNSDLVYRQGRNGDFIGCSAFPKCTFTKAIIKDTGVTCPRCGGNIVEKLSKRGKVFYGCNNYPDCDYATWDKPTGDYCEECGDLMIHKKNRYMDKVICNNPECKNHE